MEYTRLDLAEGLCNLEDDSVDIVLMSEILEHLAFNPLVLWKELHRILKNNGRIYITTPNSMYFRSVLKAIDGIAMNGQIGCSVDDIFNTGTYGHHWKEYSIKEIENYFLQMDCGFKILRYEVETLGKNLDEEREAAGDILNLTDYPSISRALISKIESSGLYPFGNQIFVEVGLNKNSDFLKTPPWYVD